MNSNDLNGGQGGGLFDEILKQLGSEDSVLRAQLNDQRLSKLAEYEVTHGYINVKVTADQLQQKFKDFKNLVRSGDFTLKALEDDVYNRWGVQEESRENSNDTNTKPITGFSFDEMDVADMDEKDERNH